MIESLERAERDTLRGPLPMMNHYILGFSAVTNQRA
jgi:hypothetical protein